MFCDVTLYDFWFFVKCIDDALLHFSFGEVLVQIKGALKIAWVQSQFGDW